MDTFQIITTVLTERIYEVEADSSEEAEAKYFKELPSPVSETNVDWYEGDFNVQVKVELI